MKGIWFYVKFKHCSLCSGVFFFPSRSDYSHTCTDLYLPEDLELFPFVMSSSLVLWVLTLHKLVPLVSPDSQLHLLNSEIPPDSLGSPSQAVLEAL